ncbi:MAG: sigma-70 family RNA polymerase sigma factor [Pseudomonadota bacterium]
MDSPSHNHSHPTADADAFHVAIEARSPQWLAACQRITRSASLAEDALQDGLAQAWAKREQFGAHASLATWIHRIVVNAALQLMRSRRRYVWDESGLELQDPEPQPDVQTESDHFVSQLTTLLSRLTQVEHTAFVLRHFEQWRLKEIAAAMDTNEGRVKQALFRAVRKLRASEKTIRNMA